VNSDERPRVDGLFLIELKLEAFGKLEEHDTSKIKCVFVQCYDLTERICKFLSVFTDVTGLNISGAL